MRAAINQLVALTYEIAMGEQSWQQFLAALTTHCKLQGGALLYVDQDNETKIVAQVPLADIKSGAPDRNVDSTTDNRWFYDVPADLPGKLQLILSAPFDHSKESHNETVQRLLPHIGRSFSILSSLDTPADTGHRAAKGLVDSLTVAVLLVDRRAGLILHMNPAAQLYFGTTLAEQSNKDINNLVRKIRMANANKNATAISLYQPFEWQLRDHTEFALVIPLDRHAAPTSALDGDQMALVFLHNPNTVPELQTSYLSERYSLTPKEARLALGIAYGGSLQSLSADFSVSVLTLKSQLKSVLKKCKASTQAQMTITLLGDDVLLFANAKS